MSDQLPSVGEELARAREGAGMSVAAMSDATRLRRTVIEAIERDDLAPAGGMAYARGHIKTMCRVLGIDAAPLLARLGAPTVAETSPHPDDTTAPEAAPSGRSLSGMLADSVGTAAATQRRGPNWTAVMAAALAVVVAVGVFQLMRTGTSAPPPVGAPGTTGPAVVAPPDSSGATPPTTPTTPGPSTSPDGGNAIAQADGVDVVLTITGTRSWVSATTSKGTLFEGILSNGDRRTFHDRKRIKFVFGDAGSVSLTVNGVDVGAPGGDGRVVRTSFGPGDPRQAQA